MTEQCIFSWESRRVSVRCLCWLFSRPPSSDLPFHSSVKSGGPGDGAAAAERLEFYVRDLIVFVKFKGKPQGVAAGDIAHFAVAVGGLDFTDVTRV